MLIIWSLGFFTDSLQSEIFVNLETSIPLDIQGSKPWVFLLSFFCKRGKCKLYNSWNMFENSSKELFALSIEVIRFQEIARIDSEKRAVLTSEKSLYEILVFFALTFLALEKWKIGKWSDNFVTSITDSKFSAWELVRIWSITEAECGVQRVGFNTSCKNPNENSRSIYSVTFFIMPYLRTSRLKSPNNSTGVFKLDKSSSRLVRRSKNWINCSLEEKRWWEVLGLYMEPTIIFWLVVGSQISAKIDSKILSIKIHLSSRMLKRTPFLK